MAPTDEKVYLMRDDEKARLDNLHDVCLALAEGNLFWAPIRQPRRVLELGSGNGLWMKEFASQFSPEEIVGIDLEEPSVLSSPLSFHFIKQDLEEKWKVPRNHFDFIHARWLVGCLSDWEQFFQQSYDSLTDDGWFEILDIAFPSLSDDGSLGSNSHTAQWNSLLVKASHVARRPLDAAHLFKAHMARVGFDMISVATHRIPQNPWSEDPREKRLAEMMLPIHKEGHHRLGHDFLCPHLGMSIADVDDMLGRVWKEMDDPKIHAYWNIHVVYGKKTARSM